MLYKRRKIATGINNFSFNRIRKNNNSHFCSFDSEICQYYSNFSSHCTKTVVVGKISNTIINSYLYYVCSYFNAIKSSYIYAPQKII